MPPGDPVELDEVWRKRSVNLSNYVLYSLLIIGEEQRNSEFPPVLNHTMNAAHGSRGIIQYRSARILDKTRFLAARRLDRMDTSMRCRMFPAMTSPLDESAQCLRDARAIAVLTGAGISAESGIPTFRDALTGLWAKYDPAELATPQAFARDPELVSRWYDERRCKVAQCRPNSGHLALDRLQKIVIGQGKMFTLVTQNVDRLHQAAGSQDVIELHGSLWVWRCIDCGKETEERGPAFGSYPLACACSGLLRPGVIWFGEPVPHAALAAAQAAVRECDLFLSIGTSSVVYPAAGMIDQAILAGAKVIEVNPQPTSFSDQVSWSIRGNSGDVLPGLVQCAFG
jgi:NAD-dependent deacetylase